MSENVENAASAATSAEHSLQAGEAQNSELSFPEGMELSEDEQSRFNKDIQELKLDGAGAQKFLEISQRNKHSMLDTHTKQVNAWRDETYNAKDIGGAALESTVAYAKASLEKFDQSGQLLGLLDQTGYGNNPHVLRFLSAIGRTHAEDKIILGSPSKTEAPRHERLYGKYNTK